MTASVAPRILIAGIGNSFLGDDGFGVEVVRRLAQRSIPPRVSVVDFGIRGFDLALGLQERYDAVVLVDALRRGNAPGTVYLLRINEEDIGVAAPHADTANAHTINPLAALQLAHAMGAASSRLENVYLVGCEPQFIGSGVELADELSPPVRAAVDEAVAMIESLVSQTLDREPCTNSPSP